MRLEQTVPKRKDIEEWLKEVSERGNEKASERIERRKKHVEKKIEQLKIPEEAKKKILSDLDNYPIIKKDRPKPASREV